MENNNELSFGHLVKQKRLTMGYGLREFTQLIGVDAFDWSRIERAISAPPSTESDLFYKVVSSLKLNVFEITLFKKSVNTFKKREEEILNLLPAFFPTADGNKPTENEIDHLIEVVADLVAKRDKKKYADSNQYLMFETASRVFGREPDTIRWWRDGTIAFGFLKWSDILKRAEEELQYMNTVDFEIEMEKFKKIKTFYESANSSLR